MYILTNSSEENENEIVCITKTLERQQENNYYLVNNNSLAIPPQFIKDVFEVDIPTIIDGKPVSIEENKWCYTPEEGFYKNINYKEYYTEEQRLEALEQMMNELILGGLDNE